MNDPVGAVIKQLERDAEQRKRQNAEWRPTRIEARNGDGTTMFKPLTGECVARGSLCPEAVGEIVERPCRPPFNQQGAAGLPMNSTIHDQATASVDHIEPDLRRGMLQTVSVIGFGFLPTTLLDFCEYGSRIINESVTQLERRFISVNELELDLDVAADAELLYDTDGNFIPLPVTFE